MKGNGYNLDKSVPWEIENNLTSYFSLKKIIVYGVEPNQACSDAELLCNISQV